MTTKEKYNYWLHLAQYDLDSAQTMYDGGRWFYTAIMCQQALEKLCKGLYNFYIGDNVPRVHNIPFILSELEKALSFIIKPGLYELLDKLSSLYTHNRYPDFSTKQTIQIDKIYAADLLNKTKEAFAWLLTLKK